MKKYLCLFLFVIGFVLIAKSQSYLGYTNNSVNFRLGPNTTSSIHNTLNPNHLLFIINLNKINGYYHVIEISTNTEGYVHSNYVDIDEEVDKNTENVFNPVSESNNYKPEISIYNNTRQNIKVMINDISYQFSPQQRREITCSPGECSYIASSSGVIPYYGAESLLSNYEYEWEFYIIYN